MGFTNKKTENESAASIQKKNKQAKDLRTQEGWHNLPGAAKGNDIPIHSRNWLDKSTAILCDFLFEEFNVTLHFAHHPPCLSLQSPYYLL